MKKILLSLGVIAVVGVAAIGATGAFYADTETSQNNIFVAGAVDLKVDHTYASYNGQPCVGDCTETGNDLVVNGGFEFPEPTANGGQWQVYPENLLDEVPGWDVVSGAGLEIQENVAGAAHSGNQKAELDSHGAGSQSVIKQVINTVPGQQYRLKFWHSPRPNNGPAGDNAVNMKVLVTSNSGILVNDTVGVAAVGGGNTVWTEYVYNFIALDTQTTIQFGDAGTQADTLGGYLDDVSLRALTCTQNSGFPYGGICTLWGERDLGQGDRFWFFPDIKPGDWGKNTISLHVYSNDAYACLFPGNIQDDENTVVDPELTALPVNDNNLNGIPNGELSGELEFFLFTDVNGNNQYDGANNEPVLVPAGTPFNQIPIQLVQLSLQGNAPITLVGVEWCAGDQTGPLATGQNVPIQCNPNGMGNIAQTDKMTADFIAYAVQQRNNPNFSCQQAFNELFPQP